jgi:hypothetical protein
MHEFLSGKVGDVLARLRSLQSLPDAGLLCGGAVANLLWNDRSGNHAPVNDIDIFKLVPVTCLRTFCLNVYGMDVPRQGNVRSMRRNGSHDGLLNYVTVYSENPDAQNVIDNLDLNCTMVGIDLATERLYYHPAFVDFLETGLVRIVNPHTPLVSAIRLLNKTRQLGARAHFHPQLLDVIARLGNRMPGFGDKYASLFVEHEAVLGKYFVLVERAKDWTVRVRSELPTEESSGVLF